MKRTADAQESADKGLLIRAFLRIRGSFMRTNHTVGQHV